MTKKPSVLMVGQQGLATGIGHHVQDQKLVGGYYHFGGDPSYPEDVFHDIPHIRLVMERDWSFEGAPFDVLIYVCDVVPRAGHALGRRTLESFNRAQVGLINVVSELEELFIKGPLVLVVDVVGGNYDSVGRAIASMCPAIFAMLKSEGYFEQFNFRHLVFGSEMDAREPYHWVTDQFTNWMEPVADTAQEVGA